MHSRLLRKELSMLMTFVLAIGFGFLGLAAAGWYAQARIFGILQKWVSLGTPPARAISIQEAATGPIYREILVNAADGKSYIYDLSDAKWVEMTLKDPKKIDIHNCSNGIKPYSPPHEIIDCEGKYNWEWQATGDYYVVLDDGSVWIWQYGIGLVESLTFSVIMIILGIFSGFFLAKPIRKIIFQN